jgi:quercetin dioxygenase-like cupin family protein
MTSQPNLTTQEEIRIGQLVIRFLLEGPASGGSIAMFQFDVPPGAKVPVAHSHDAYEETLYGLEGILTGTVDGRPTEVGPGDVLCIPRGVVHRFDNLYPENSKTLAVITPGILAPAYFRHPASSFSAAAPWLSSERPVAASAPNPVGRLQVDERPTHQKIE